MKIPLTLKKLFRRRIVLAAGICLLIVVAVALLANVVCGYDPNDTAVRERLSAPTAKHLLGTDELGRDLFARIAFGARYSLTIAALTAIGSIVLGTLFGLVAGFFRRLDAPIRFGSPPAAVATARLHNAGFGGYWLWGATRAALLAAPVVWHEVKCLRYMSDPRGSSRSGRSSR